MISLRRRDRLGNCLFEYCFARILAERFGYRLEATPLAGFPGTKTPVAGEEVLGPVVVWNEQWPREAYSGRPLVRAELYQAPEARLVLDGWFQRWEFFREHAAVIRRDWLRLPEPVAARPASEFAIYLRLGADELPVGEAEPPEDGAGFAAGILSEAEIRRLVRTVPHTRLTIITDRPRHPFLESLGDLGAEVFGEGRMADFRAIAAFQKVAICQSTFQWWAAFLGHAREIYFPKCDRGVWSHPEPARFAYEPPHHGIDLRVDEERYVYDW